jgi:hypothetical protein
MTIKYYLNRYGTLGRIIPKQDTISALKRLFLDQTAFALPFCAIFMSSLAVLEGEAATIPDRVCFFFSASSVS